MGCSFPMASVCDIASVTTGKTNRQDAVPDGAYPLFDRSKETKRSHRYLFDCKAIIVPGEGATFEPRYYSGKFDLHQRCYAVIPDESAVDAYYLYCAMQSNKDHLAHVAVGSTVKSLRLSSFESMLIPLPPMDIQQRIAYVMRQIDLKIVNNNQTNDYLA